MLKQPERRSSWTKGAALDIIVYKEDKQIFDYKQPN